MMVANIVGKFFKSRSRKSRTTRVFRHAVAPVMEPLGEIVLLSATYEYDVPAGHSAVYLERLNGFPGRVDVYLDNPITGTVGHHFTDPTGLDIIRSADAGATLVDQVPAAFKPTGGIKYEGASGNTFEIDLGPTDQNVEVGGAIPNTSPIAYDPTKILSTDASDLNNVAVRLDQIGGSITTLKIVTGINSTGTADGGTRVQVFTIVPTVHLNIDTGGATYSNVILGGGENASITGAEVHTGAGHSAVTVTAQDSSDVDGITTATVYEGTGTGNSLIVGAGGVATLTNPGATLAEDSVTVQSGGTLTVAGAAAINTLDVQTGGIGTIAVPSTIQAVTVNGTIVVAAQTTIGTATGAGLLQFTAAGNGSTSGSVTSTGTVEVDTGAAITITGPSTLNLLTGNGTTDFTPTSGSSVIGTVTAGTGTVQVDRGANILIQGASTIGTLTGRGTTEFGINSGDSIVSTINAITGTVIVDTGAKVSTVNASTVGTYKI